MKHRTKRSTVGATRKSGPGNSRPQPRLIGPVGRQIDDIYFQLDDQLTRMAEIQLQFDRLRSKIRLL
jgi:hypothetical protein